MKNFLNNFWGYREAISPVKYSFTWKHLVVFFSVMAFVVFFSMLLTRKNENRQKIFLIIAGVLMAIFEIVRLVWNQAMLKGKGIELTFWNIADLDMFHISLWVSIVAIFLAIGLGHKRAFSQFLLNFIFSVTCVVAILDIIWPAGLDNSPYLIYHFTNLEYIISRALVILVSIFIGCTDWLNNSIDDIWKAILSLILIFALGTGFYFLSGSLVDIIYINGCPWIEMTGLVIPSPWHLLIVVLFFFGMQIMMYIPFAIYRKVHNR